jgi:two-component system, cell cycle sensor histidine kinase and response regulator CckA
MIKMNNSERLFRDQVQRILEHAFSGIFATAINSIILALALWNIIPKFRIIIWLFSSIFFALARVFISFHFQKTATTGKNAVKRKNYIVLSLAISGCIWGSAGMILFPYSSMVHQVFMAFVLGGMVAGTVGVFASIKSAFYCFSIPALLPILINLFRMNSPIHYAMGAMLFVFWLIMLITAMRLNRELIDALNLKYENLELISDLEREIRDRKNAEERLLIKNQQIEAIVHERTAELRNVNEKLMNEINERKEAEDALKISEQKYRELADSLPEIVFETDEYGNVTFLNSNTLNLTGYDENYFKKGINALELLVPEDRDRARGDIQKILKGATSHGNEYSALKKDKGTFPISVHVNPIIRDKRPVGMRGIIIDLTEKKLADKEQKEIEAKLKRAEKMETLGVMAGGVAHDLNNILSGIVSYPELLLLQLPPDSALRKPLMTMQSSGKKAAAIVQDLLTLTRRGVVNESPVNLNDIIEEYLQSPEYQKLMSFHSGVQLKVDLEKELLRILGSPVHLTKTVMNLISNAAEAMPNGGRISLSTRNQYLDTPLKGYDDIAKGDYIVFSVSDNGTGISENDINRIFEPFFTKKIMGRSGTGLGMSVVWGTVKDHKGYINVESTEGKGTVFSLFFPVTRIESDNEKPSESIESCYGNGESILLVDDAKDQREIASTLLAQIGYSVTAVSSGEEAISYITDNEVDLVVLDMIMDPGIDGLDTYRKILEIRPGQKAIIASGFSETGRVKEAQSIGAGAYVQKPYTLLKLGIPVKKELEKISGPGVDIGTIE